jgi:tetratricopeptide (TPR) repeat protein
MMRYTAALLVCLVLATPTWRPSSWLPLIGWFLSWSPASGFVRIPADRRSWGRAGGRSPEGAADQGAGTGAAGVAQREGAYRANNIGVAQLEQFDYKSAEQSFRDALELLPTLSIARLNLAIAVFYAGRPGDAVVEARTAARELPASPEAYYILGLTARADDKLDEAVAAFERVLKLDPADAGSKIQLGQIQLQQRRYDEAIALFQKALEAEPFNVTAAYSVALALTRAGQADAGRTAMQRFEALRDAPYGVTYSQNYLGQGKYAAAIASTGAEPGLVNPAAPAVTFTERSMSGGAIAQAAPGKGSPGGVLLFDADGDGDLDVADAGRGGVRFFRNGGAGQFTDESTRSRIAGASDARGVLAGDYDNDSRPDLLILAATGLRLLHQGTDSTFEDVTQPAGVSLGGTTVASAAFADVDHDGDLDIVAAGERVTLLRNNGSGVFADAAAAAGLTAKLGMPLTIAASDVDNGRDIDLLIAAAGQSPLYYRNLRDGTFRNLAAEAGLPDATDYTAFAVGDVNKDGYVDLFLGGQRSAPAFAMSDGHGGFRSGKSPDGAKGALAAQFADYDNDGLLDLVTLSATGIRVFRNLGGDRWEDAQGPRLEAGNAADAGWQSMALGDVDGDGDTDVVVRESSGRLRLFGNEGGNGNASLRVRLASRVSNRAAVGAKVEVRAGSLRQMLETSSSMPAVAPADLNFGLGPRQGPDVARVLWPSGILQAETSFDAGSGGADTGRPKPAASRPGRSITITELDRKPSSCPYLFTWNGSRFEFVTDFMGGGEMGAWLGPSMWNHPDPDEYVRIAGTQLRPRDGQYELRLTNELEEALFFDRVQLLAVDHPADVLVFPNEGLKSPPRPAFSLTPVSGPRPPARARDEHGHDVLPQLSSVDRWYVDDFATLPIRGYAHPHELVLDLGPDSGEAVLLLTGWTDYAFSNDNVAASQAGIAMSPPLLQVRDRGGAWRTVVGEIGFPVGRPQTVVVEMRGRFLSESREVRILTNMRIYWDQVLVGRERPASDVIVTRVEPGVARLRERGLSAETTPDGREPFAYDYHRVSPPHRWKVMVGRYTTVGDVLPLLRATDDMFVISKPGDEIALSFPALPPARPGRERTFLLYVHGYSKEMNPRSASPHTVQPLPFRAMSGYPYGAAERYPQTRKHRTYQERYNTRIVTRPVPSIDALLEGGTR